MSTTTTQTELTNKGLEIANYIASREIADEGRGFMVMGAYVNERDGHAYENTCHVGCKTWDRSSGRCSTHPVIDHGKVTNPGALARLKKSV